jgi:hypothetical protein
MTIENVLDGQFGQGELTMTRQEISDIVNDLKRIKLSLENVDNINSFIKEYKNLYQDEIISYILHLIDTTDYGDKNWDAVVKLVRSNEDMCNIIKHNCTPKKSNQKPKKAPTIIVSDKDPYGEEDWGE